MEPHRRYNPLKDEWLIVAANRVQRPWQGAVENKPSGQTTTDDDDSSTISVAPNPLAPGAIRASGAINEAYTSTFVFTNDYPTLKPNASVPDAIGHRLFINGAATGTCRVMCFHPDSRLTLATMPIDSVYEGVCFPIKLHLFPVMRVWIEQMRELSPIYDWVQIFENKGAIVGCSNPHPHCQIWAGNFLPNEPATKDRTQRRYFEQHQRSMLVDYVDEEMRRGGERVVYENADWIVLVPYWAVWPYETMIVPKRSIQRIQDLSVDEQRSGCQAMQQLLMRYDKLFGCSFPYSMGWQGNINEQLSKSSFKGAPTGKYLNDDNRHWQLHAVYLPPLLRSATVKKFMAGYELVCEPQRDLTPEQAAAQLRSITCP